MATEVKRYLSADGKEHHSAEEADIWDANHAAAKAKKERSDKLKYGKENKLRLTAKSIRDIQEFLIMRFAKLGSTLQFRKMSPHYYADLGHNHSGNKAPIGVKEPRNNDPWHKYPGIKMSVEVAITHRGSGYKPSLSDVVSAYYRLKIPRIAGLYADSWNSNLSFFLDDFPLIKDRMEKYTDALLIEKNIKDAATQLANKRREEAWKLDTVTKCIKHINEKQGEIQSLQSEIEMVEQMKQININKHVNAVTYPAMTKKQVEHLKRMQAEFGNLYLPEDVLLAKRGKK